MPTITFHLDREHIALNDLLKLTGVAGSGGEGKALVASGAVSVDGVVETRKTCKIRSGQRVRAGEVEILVRDDAAHRA
jgi:ribosome-associated protein